MSDARSADFDPKAFRSALGCFATGVTVVTTRTADGEPVGLTANSFNSVSLQPPLVLWSLARNSHSLPAFSAAANWVVHVLAADQETLSQRFATRGIDKFAGLEVDEGQAGMPLLKGCAARFQCRTAFQYDGGDHVIFVGEVLAFDRSPAAPLVFHDGRYALTLPKDAEYPSGSLLTGNFSKDFLGYLVGRCHFLIHRQLRQDTASPEIGSDEYFVLSALAVHERLSSPQLTSLLSGLLSGELADALSALAAQGHVRPDGQGAARLWVLADSGRARALRKMAAAKTLEARVADRFGGQDTYVLKSLLKRFMDVMGGSPQ